MEHDIGTQHSLHNLGKLQSSATNEQKEPQAGPKDEKAKVYERQQKRVTKKHAKVK